MVGSLCSVCCSPDRAAIDKKLLDVALGLSTVADIARTHGLSRQALMRHRDGHLRADLKAAAAVQRTEDAYDRGASLIDRLHTLNAEALDALNDAKGLKDTRLILAAITTASRLIELQGKLQGELGGSGDTTINITHNDFRTLQVAIVAALEPFPDAKQAVLRALTMPLVEG